VLRAPDDVAGMAEAVIGLVSDPQRHSAMAARAAADVRARFSAEAIVPQYERYYEAVLRGNG
jgi:glycosyltransferase involved in cell wall biosynthesis